ncbi:DUF2180 family protein [Streptomyces pathocidini]|uniref:DUF2180 family protein n=1 Tax=Streptomyces pathocidini TaxID=1650571 RepID=UPI0033F9A358
MWCYDCAELGREAGSVGVCRDCGAAVCPAHAVAVEHPVRRPAGLAQSTSRPARRVTCRVCRPAHPAAAAPSARTPAAAHRTA